MLKDALGYKIITLLENMRSYTKQPLSEIGITHGLSLLLFTFQKMKELPKLNLLKFIEKIEILLEETSMHSKSKILLLENAEWKIDVHILYI